jgi:putative transposase
VIAAHHHTLAANSGKVIALRELFPEFRSAMGHLASISRQELLSGEQLVHWRVMPNDYVAFPTRLSARQLKSAQNMVYANLSGWLVRLQDRVRELITGSTLPERDKTVLYRINARKAWWVPALELPWAVDGQRLAPVEHTRVATTPEAVWITAPPTMMALARRLAKQAAKQIRFPNFSRVNTLTLDGIVAKVEPARTATQHGRVDHWVKVATLVRRKPVHVPLVATRGSPGNSPRHATEAGSCARRSNCTEPNTVSRSH